MMSYLNAYNGEKKHGNQLRGALARLLAAPNLLGAATVENWNVIVPLARSAGLLARIAVMLEARDLLSHVPKQPREHLLADKALAEKHARDVNWEVTLLRRALSPIGVPVLLLKGAAYLLGDLPAAQGRVFADIDILVPSDQLAAVEEALQRHGWKFADDLHPYDANYYRRYMHQIPPLLHRDRGTSVDVHHTIVPPSARNPVDAGPVIKAAVPVAAGISVPQTTDLILHSAVHLFNEGQFRRGLRDLHDMDCLIRHMASDPGFAVNLVARAQTLNLVAPLYFALRYTRRLFGAPLSEQMLRGHPAVPAAGRLALMDALFLNVLDAPYNRCRTPTQEVANFALYVRSHYLRMPFHLLAPHLAKKAWRGLTEGPQSI